MIFGLFFVAFPVLALSLADQEIPLQWKGVMALFFVWGVWMFVAGLFNIDHDSALSSFAGSIITACFAVVAWVFAWRQKTSGSGGLPFLPDAWNQIIGRLVLALGGLLLAIAAVAFSRTAMRKRRKDDDDVV
ncbi:MAG: hypothetical protein P4M10_04630 [Verrucomicrobiae bacterium]|nr:hypothetical protein [Verrucomicrobiae bacterium]